MHSQNAEHEQNVNSFPATKPMGQPRCFLSLQPDTSLHCKTIDTKLVHRAVCLSLVLVAPLYGGMARLSWPGCTRTQ